MLLDVRDVERKKPWTGTRKAYSVKCDSCGKEYEIFHRKDSDDRKDFCSIVCKSDSQRRGGILFEKTRNSCLEKYGTDSPAKNEQVKERSKSTCLKKYGVEFTGQVPSTREKAKNTSLERYGVEHILQSDLGKEKFRNTSYERYGTAHPNQNQEIRKKISESNSSPAAKKKREKTNIERYGYSTPMLNEDIKKKYEESLIKKYGTSNLFTVEEIKEKIKKTLFERYGCLNPMNSQPFKDKRLETLKKSRKHGTSRPENLLYEHLCFIFGENDVERHVIVNGWEIDIHVKSLNYYIQHDGSYHHGLDRPVDEIFKFKNPTDKTIYKTYLRDLEQKKYFEEKGMTLLRIVDYKGELL